MLTKAGCQERVGQLLERLKGRCQAVILADPRHIGYLSGFFMNPATLNVHGQSFLVVEPEGRTTLITDNWQAEAAHTSHADSVEIFDWYDEENPAGERRRLAVHALFGYLQRTNLKPQRIGIEMNALVVEVVEKLRGQYPGITFVDVWDNLIEMRRRKYADEVDCVRRAIRACEAGFAAIRRELRPGMTEFDVYSLAHRAALLEAGEPITAVGDFVSGAERTAVGGGFPTRRVVQPGELFIMDFGVGTGGYAADMCNTFVVGGQPTDEQRRRLAVLEQALAAAEEGLRPGARALEVYQAVVNVLAGEGLAEAFWGHGGHGLGLDSPEAPFIVRRSEETLEPGNVIAIEPGIYLKGWGGMRIEDDYLITVNGYERLSHHVKGL